MLSIIFYHLVSRIPEMFSVLGAIIRSLRSIIYGIGIAYLLDPVVSRLEIPLTTWLEKKLSSPDRAPSFARRLSIAISLILLIILVYALLAMVIPQLIDSIATIAASMPSYYDTINAWIQKLVPESMQSAAATGNDLLSSAYTYVNNWLSTTALPKIQSMAASFTSSLFDLVRVLFNILIGLIISIYLLSKKKRFLSQVKKASYAFFGSQHSGYINNICSYANRMFGSFIGGKIIDSVIIGILCLIGLIILRVPYAMLISIIVCVTNVIPFFGPYIGAVPSALLLLMVSPIKCLTFVIFILILQQIDGNVIGPAILGDATGLENFWVIFAILLFGNLWGFIGMVVGVPLFAVLYALLSDVINRLLVRHGLSTNTEDYENWNYPPRPDSILIQPVEKKTHWSIRFFHKIALAVKQFIQGHNS